MSRIAYTVSCRIDDPRKAEEWLAWLRGGHIQHVLDGGAASAEIIRHDPEEDASVTIEIRYYFDSRDALDSYLAVHAPRLRADGLKRFPPEDGFTYSRTIGAVVS